MAYLVYDYRSGGMVRGGETEPLLVEEALFFERLQDEALRDGDPSERDNIQDIMDERSGMPCENPKPVGAW